MSRTIKEVRVFSRKPEEIKNYLRDWFSENSFKINKEKSDGSSFNVRHWCSWIGCKISPHLGSIVAIRLDMSGCIVFETSLREEDSGTVIHGEFYAAGAEFWRGREFDLSPNPSAMAKWPRKKGYEMMAELLQRLGSL